MSNNINYNPKKIEKWTCKNINESNKQSEKITSNKLLIFYGFLVGFIFSLPLVYIEYTYPITIDLFSQDWFEKMGLIVVASITGSVIEMYLVLRISAKLVSNLSKEYGYDFEDLKNSYILGFDHLLSRLVIGVEEPKVPLDTIDAYKNRNRIKKFLKSFFYKLRITLSNALTKFIIRRVFIQNGLRVSVEWVAAFVIGFWNAIAVYLIYRKTNKLMQSMQKVDRYLNDIDKDKFNFLVAYQVIGNILVLSGENIPIIQYMYFELKKLDVNCDVNVKHELDDIELLKENLRSISPNERKIYQNLFDFILEQANLKDDKIISLKSLF